MLYSFKKNIIAIFCAICVSSAYAAEGYVEQVWNNNTNYDCFVMTHQKFFFPIEFCQGVVENHNSKTCSGSLYLGQPYHMYNIICTRKEDDSTSTIELNGSYRISYGSSQSVQLIWDINPTTDEKSLDIKITLKAM